MKKAAMYMYNTAVQLMENTRVALSESATEWRMKGESTPESRHHDTLKTEDEPAVDENLSQKKSI